MEIGPAGASIDMPRSTEALQASVWQTIETRAKRKVSGLINPYKVVSIAAPFGTHVKQNRSMKARSAQRYLHAEAISNRGKPRRASNSYFCLATDRFDFELKPLVSRIGTLLARGRLIGSRPGSKVLFSKNPLGCIYEQLIAIAPRRVPITRSFRPEPRRIAHNRPIFLRQGN